MSLHKLSAGTGYTYLTRQVAAHDHSGVAGSQLASYYTERGETPGRWVGSGMAGIDGLEVGDEVTAEQMRALFGAGLHPLAAHRRERLEGPDLTRSDFRAVTRLGAPFRVYSSDVTSFRVEVARRIEDLAASLGHPRDYPVSMQDKARIRTQVAVEMFRGEHGRGPRDVRELSGVIARLSRPQTTAVAGYDLTFSPVKSVSTLWAIAPPQVAAQIELAHQDAVADALAFIEAHALYTREGASGVRQVDVSGLVAVAFTHRDSRAGDPDLHTHVAVANKVQALSGKWLSIDGRILYKANVTASETYNTALEKHLRTRLGLYFAERAGTDRGRRPIREVVGVDPRLNRRWSTRRASIEDRRTALSATFQADHGRPPTVIEAIALAQQATLETRQGKHEPRTFAEQRAAWLAQARDVLGGPSAIAKMVTAALTATPTAGFTALDGAWVATTGDLVRDSLQASRSTWQLWHVRAEAQRRVRAANLTPDDVERAVDLVTEHALTHASIRLTRTSDGVDEPDILRRTDGSSVYEVAGSVVYSSASILIAEQHLVDTAGVHDRHRAGADAVSLALLEMAANGVTLNTGQASLVRGMATSGARLQLGLAPAGAGKTTAMRALASAWAEDGGTILGLAPSAAAAAVLRDQIGGATDTLAKLIWSIDHDDLPDWAAAIGPRTLVVIDEAGMADTFSLAAAVTFITDRGGQVRLIGDNQQLAAVGAGGVLRDIAATHGALNLTELVRFRDPAEAAASLALRDGQLEALGFYLDNNRIHVGDLSTATDDLFSAWVTDRANGLDAVMLAPTRELVTALNQRAQTHRLRGTTPGAGAVLADGNTAHVGERIITRSNDRRLRLGGTDWVKNGDRWTVLQVAPDGALFVEHARTQRQVTLPPAYVATATELGYATTVHGAQGVSVDTVHGLATGAETRQQLYTMLTRGAVANHLHLQVVSDGDAHDIIRPENVHPPTATDLLEGILTRDDAPTSAATLQREQNQPAPRLGRAAARYLDALHVAAEDHLGPHAAVAIDKTAAALVPGLHDEPAWPTLRAHLILLAAAGANPGTALDRALAGRDLDSAHDRAAVLDWRLDDTALSNSGPGPLPWLPAIPAALTSHPTWGPYLTARAALVHQAAADVTATIATRARPAAWVRPGQATPGPDLLTDIELWRAATDVPETDRRPTGGRHLSKAPAAWQRHLEARLAGPGSAALAEWGDLLRTLDPNLTTDPDAGLLADRLAAISRAGVNAPARLRAAMDAGPLPDDHAAGALWWRISRDLAPAVALRADGDQPLAPAWTQQVRTDMGSDRAARLEASPWWPALVATVDRALARGQSIQEITGLLESYDPLVDIDECQAMVWRLSVLADPPPVVEQPLPETGVRDDDDETPPWLGDSEVVLHAPSPAEWHQLVPAADTAPDAGSDTAGPDVYAQLGLAALHRQTLGVLEPTDAQIERMVQRAAAWDHAVCGPQRMTAINAMAMDFYAARVDDTWVGGYLDQRLLGWREHARVQAGYAPAGWTSLVDHLGGRGVTDDELLQTGLATRARTGRLIDRFRNRAVFPIVHDHQILGFVGRRHPDRDNEEHSGPKYLNTADTVLFHKGAQLFGVTPELADDTAVPVLVEGPVDALAVTLAGGDRYVGVAALGTSLTDEQARQLATLSNQPIIATDADAAGRSAAERDFWLLAQHGVDPQAATLPEGADPASVLQALGTGGLLELLTTTRPLADVVLQGHLTDPTHPDAIWTAAEVIGATSEQTWASHISSVAQRLAVDEASVVAAVLRAATEWNHDPARVAEAALSARHDNIHVEGHVRTTEQGIAGLVDALDPGLQTQAEWPALRLLLMTAQEAGADITPLLNDAGRQVASGALSAADLRYQIAALLPPLEPVDAGNAPAEARPRPDQERIASINAPLQRRSPLR